MSIFNKKIKPEKFAEKTFEAILYYSNENDKFFKNNVCKNFNATLFIFFLLYMALTL